MELTEHPRRADSIGEIHARPFDAVPVPSVVMHFGFGTAGQANEHSGAFRHALCAAAGLAPASDNAKLLRCSIDTVDVRWEQHTEFETLTVILPAEVEGDGLSVLPLALRNVCEDPPGPVLVATRIEITDATARDTGGFAEASFCESSVRSGAATVGTDFLADEGGYTRFLIGAASLSPRTAGVLVRQLLEIETYRTFAMLGLPEAQRLSPVLGEIERAVADATRKMLDDHSFEANNGLLENLTAQAARLEAEAAATSYRFGATAAYYEILNDRLAALDETSIGSNPTLGGFLTRRISPAIRTCKAATDRISELSRRLTRAANLLRTRVDIAQEAQNQNVLKSMDRRARLQLRLQQTVEGLSVAAVSYYVVGLVGYLAKGTSFFGVKLPSELVTAIAVPVVVLAVWMLVRRIRRGHSE